MYDSFFRPYVSKHEPVIDRSLSELKLKASDAAVIYFRRAASYFQTTLFDIFSKFNTSNPSAAAPPPPKVNATTSFVRFNSPYSNKDEN